MEPQKSLRIYCKLELNLRIKPRKRLKMDKPGALAVPEKPNMTWSMDFVADHACKHALLGSAWIEKWIACYNAERPHSTHGILTPDEAYDRKIGPKRSAA
jgi:hypothetical protein